MAFVSTAAGICSNTAKAMNIVSILTSSPFLFVVIFTLSKTVECISGKFNMEMPLGDIICKLSLHWSLNPSTGSRITFLEFFVVRQKRH